MIPLIKGSVVAIYPDDINTDDIIPAWTLQESTEKDFFGKYAFSNYDQNFVAGCKKNRSNIIVAGNNFGCGSSREQAVYALLANNVKVVIAKSFPDIFYRNALNNGLILITLAKITGFKKSNNITIDLNKKIIINNNKQIEFLLSKVELNNYTAGGKINRVKQDLANRKQTDNKIKTKSSKPQTIVEKIISIKTKKTVFAGEYLDKIPIDTLFFNEVIGPPAIKYFQNSFSKVFDNKKIFFIPDHTVPSSSVWVSEGITIMENFAKVHKIKCYKEGDGIEHIVLMEDGYIIPGNIILGTDSHTDTNGALNCLSFGVGKTDAYLALASGYLYDFFVPGTIRINLTGNFTKGVYAKDMILSIIGKYGVDYAVNKVLEFGGPALPNLSIDARTTIANMEVEMGARTAIFEYDQILEKYLESKFTKHDHPIFPDKNCPYHTVLKIDLSSIEPCVAFPHKPGNVTTISKIKQYMKYTQKSKKADLVKVTTLNISDAFIGACTN